MTIDTNKYDHELGDFLSKKLKAVAIEAYEQYPENRDAEIAKVIKEYSMAILHALSAVMKECAEFALRADEEFLEEAKDWIKWHERENEKTQ